MAIKIVFVSDSFHHHQKGVADVLYELTGGSYCFITTLPLREERKKMGFVDNYPSYVFDASSRTYEIWSKAKKIIDDADTVVLGSAPYELLSNRLKAGKLTFRYSERLWKQYKHYLKIPVYMIDNFKTRNCKLLCASAFAAHDYNTMGAFKGRCYKWGYFPEIKESLETIKTSVYFEPRIGVRLMWCSRFLNWKHPELPIFLAKRLKEKGYSFSIDMYGSGQYLKKAQNLVQSLEVDDVICFKGNAPNDQIIESMRAADIFLFTSDRGEGWGVVANEAMANGCAIVASDEIGSVPYLVEDKKNGCTFHSSSRLYGFKSWGDRVDRQSLNSLTEKVEWLINNPKERSQISLEAQKTIREVWNPVAAAKNLMTLIDDIKQGRDTSIKYGPCSKA